MSAASIAVLTEFRNTYLGYQHGAEVEQKEFAVASYKATVAAFDEALKALGTDLPTWRHIKRGTEYHEVGLMKVQCETPLQDDETLTLYRDKVTGDWYGRRPAEFGDGRFEEVEHV